MISKKTLLDTLRLYKDKLKEIFISKKEMTQTEYDSLSDDDKNNGMMYLISDESNDISRIMLNGIMFNGESISTPYLPLTGGALTGGLTVSGGDIRITETGGAYRVDKTSATQACYMCSNSLRSGMLSVSNLGNLGIYDITNDTWVIRSDTDRKVYFPTGEVGITNGVRVGNTSAKTAANVIVNNSKRNGMLSVSTSGVLGIYDNTNSKWVMYSDTSGKVILPSGNVEATGGFMVASRTTATSSGFQAKNSLRQGGFYVGQSGDLGIHDVTNNKWVIKSDTNGNIYFPTGEISVTGGLSVTGNCSLGIGEGKENYFGSIWTTKKSNFAPQKDDTIYCGTGNYRWKQVCAAAPTISTSDRNYKTDFKTFDSNENYEKLFLDLKPVVFKFKNGDSGRDHFGFVSQDVEESLYKFGFNDKSFAGFCKDVKTVNTGTETCHNDVPVVDENGNEEYIYSLRYSEFISLNTYMIQKLVKENQELKEQISKIKEYLAELKG